MNVHKRHPKYLLKFKFLVPNSTNQFSRLGGAQEWETALV